MREPHQCVRQVARLNRQVLQFTGMESRRHFTIDRIDLRRPTACFYNDRVQPGHGDRLGLVGSKLQIGGEFLPGNANQVPTTGWHGIKVGTTRCSGSGVSPEARIMVPQFNDVTDRRAAVVPRHQNIDGCNLSPTHYRRQEKRQQAGKTTNQAPDKLNFSQFNPILSRPITFCPASSIKGPPSIGLLN